MEGDGNSGGDLFEIQRGKGRRRINRVVAGIISASLILIWFYRFADLYSAGGGEYWIWKISMFLAEIWFGFYWILTQSVRWNPTYRRTFKHNLSRYDKEFPRVDVFVCTADPTLEPPIMVINTVLSVMAHDYPTHKLAVYLSDDGCSVLTFYALLQAAQFSKHWLPYCKKYKVEPTSPDAYFSTNPLILNPSDFESIKELYEEMKNVIETTTELGRISEEIQGQHKGFSEWDSYSSRRDHDTILQVLLDGSDSKCKDVEGCTLPSLVYLAREKRPHHPHNFKAGAMNALIRVSSKISNGSVILNVDCDMYSNNSQSVRDALCFFMDEQRGHEIAFVQFPQNFENTTKNEIYGSFNSLNEVDFPGLDGLGGPLYIGTGCFHRRDTLCGKSFDINKKIKSRWPIQEKTELEKRKESLEEFQEKIKTVASCSYENNTPWGKEVGLKYGCPVEDVITGLSIKCKGWKSVYYNPERKGFLGLATTTLDQTLVQHKRWSEGDMLILLSKYSPLTYGFRRISPLLQMGYLIYCLWAPSSLAILFYSVIPPLHLLTGLSLFPKLSSPWFIPYAVILVVSYTQSLIEYTTSGSTVRGWWNDQRIWLYKRISSYLIAWIDNILGLMGFTSMSFIVSAKVSDAEVSERYKKEMIEFSTDSVMFVIISFIATLNLFCFVWVLKKVLVDAGFMFWEDMCLQIVVCAALVLINLPLYSALFLRKDAGKMPTSVTVKSVLMAFIVCSCFKILF